MRCLPSSVLTLVLILLWTLCNPAAFARQLVIYKSHDYTSRSYEIQHFLDSLPLQSGQMEVPLTMTIYNGSAESPSFKWFRIMINGQIIATEQDLSGKDLGSKDVTGLLQGSNLQVQIEAGGVPGANLWWTLSSESMELLSVEPQQITPGQTFKITGTNIPGTPNLLSATVGGKPARIISAGAESIGLQMPETVNPGINTIEVRTARQIANPVSAMVIARPVPEILGIDCWMAPPGGTINISGRNFSPAAVENKVYFDKVSAQVSSASPQQLSVIVPNWPYSPSQLNIPVSVEVNGVRSGNTFPFDIGPMYHGDTPSFGHD